MKCTSRALQGPIAQAGGCHFEEASFAATPRLRRRLDAASLELLGGRRVSWIPTTSPPPNMGAEACFD